jgi:hypothetical protein
LNFNQILKKLSLIIFLTFLSCLGENSWEDLESDYDHVLNVFGLISLDTSQHSYVGLYSTTDLGDTSQIYLGTDTIGWCNCDEEDCSWSEQCDTEEIEGYWIIDSLFEPAALVKNASVTVTDDSGNAHQFSFIESAFALDAEFSVSSINDVNNFRLNLYVDTSGTFYPQPLTNYNLDISAPGYNTVTGSLKTPKLPSLDSLTQLGNNVDTILVNEPFNVHWTTIEEGRGIVTGEVIIQSWGGDSLLSNWCGGYFDPFTVDLSDISSNPHTVYPWICSDSFLQISDTRDYLVRLTAVDDNYYEYFIIGEEGEYSNALLNYPTTKGRSVGIEGGFGFFGSIASDKLFLHISN